MGNRLIFLYLLDVTNEVSSISLLDWKCCEFVPGNSTNNKDRTPNRHRWTGRVYQGAWENDVEGTRQIALVTSEEEWPFIGQPVKGGTEQGVATVY